MTTSFLSPPPDDDGAQVPRIPRWREALSLAAVLGLHLHIATRIVTVNVLYLGGDTTREAWRALAFISEGRFIRDFGAFYESDLYHLFLVPFIAAFKNSVLALQAAGIFFTSVTVVLLYAFVRRKYGILAAFATGCIFATSPLLLAHMAPVSEFSVALWISLILLLETGRNPFAGKIAALLAGFFTSLHPYFLFPFAGYLAGKLAHDGFRRTRLRIKEALPPAALFLAGLSPLWYKLSTAGTFRSTGLAQWTGEFMEANAARWNDIPGLVKNFLAQLSWSLDSFAIYHPVDAPPLFSPLTLLWTVLFFLGFAGKEARRWSISLAAGFAAAALVAAPGGVGMRHFLTFLPFVWLPLASLIPAVSDKRIQYLLCLLALLFSARYLAIDRTFLRNAPLADEVIVNTEYVRALLSTSPRANIVIAADNSNLFFDARYFAPEKNIVLLAQAEGMGERTGVLLLLRRNELTPGRERFAAEMRNFHYLGDYFLSGRSVYTFLHEK